MEEKLNVDGLTIAPGVVETILSLAISQIEGVAVIGAPLPSSRATASGDEDVTVPQPADAIRASRISRRATRAIASIID